MANANNIYRGGKHMKIAISATGQTIDSMLDKRFGRCQYFIIQDTETGEVETVKNNGLTSEGGAGIAASQQLIDEGVDVIITGNLGPNAFEVIERSGIKAYKCDEIAIRYALEKYGNGELLEIQESGPAHHGGH